jgi:signal transduction histidine kinase
VIGECREGVERIAAIVRDVGGFAEHGPAGWETADLNELLDTALRVATPQLRSRARVEKSYAVLPRVRCVPRELMQVFLNLVLNAVQSFDQGGTIHLATQRAGDEICVRVEDDGRGLPPGDPARLFEAFFTTKPAGQGTGLGLAISSQIVARHGGELGAERRAGGGSVFWLRLPVTGPAAA